MTVKKTHIELHAHPYFEEYPLVDLIRAMERKGLDIISLEQLNVPIFDDVRELSSGLRDYGYIVDSDDLVMRIERDGEQRYVLRARESDTLDDFHMLTIGSDDVESWRPFRTMADEALERDSLLIYDHPFVTNGNVLKGIDPSKREEVERICIQYDRNLALEWNGYCKELYWRVNELLGKLGIDVLGGIDVNHEVLRLSERLAREGYNLPVITDTDVHARSVGALDAIGTGRIKVDGIDFTSGRTIVDSLKEAIFAGEHENTYRTVPLTHFIPHFALPYLVSKVPGIRELYNRPRG